MNEIFISHVTKILIAQSFSLVEKDKPKHFLIFEAAVQTK
jgi:hypothetical protein